MTTSPFLQCVVLSSRCIHEYICAHVRGQSEHVVGSKGLTLAHIYRPATGYASVPALVTAQQPALVSAKLLIRLSVP